jgi:hypothetical protein
MRITRKQAGVYYQRLTATNLRNTLFHESLIYLFPILALSNLRQGLLEFDRRSFSGHRSSVVRGGPCAYWQRRRTCPFRARSRIGMAAPSAAHLVAHLLCRSSHGAVVLPEVRIRTLQASH